MHEIIGNSFHLLQEYFPFGLFHHISSTPDSNQSEIRGRSVNRQNVRISYKIHSLKSVNFLIDFLFLHTLINCISGLKKSISDHLLAQSDDTFFFRVRLCLFYFHVFGVYL